MTSASASTESQARGPYAGVLLLLWSSPSSYWADSTINSSTAITASTTHDQEQEEEKEAGAKTTDVIDENGNYTTANLASRPTTASRVADFLMSTAMVNHHHHQPAADGEQQHQQQPGESQQLQAGEFDADGACSDQSASRESSASPGQESPSPPPSINGHHHHRGGKRSRKAHRRWREGVKMCLVLTVGFLPLLCVLFMTEVVTLGKQKSTCDSDAKFYPPNDIERCFSTCSLSVVESIPDNVTFENAQLPTSTYDAWRELITSAKQEILIAAYKSSLRGKHVFGGESPLSISYQGEDIFDLLVEAGRDKGVPIKMVENFPPKDRGDNEDGKSLARRGAVERRSLHFSKIFGTGTMHSKFLVVDHTHFYLGSANLDWRSLSQKMELGIMMRNCPCLTQDLRAVFSTYWALTGIQRNVTVSAGSHQNLVDTPAALYSHQRPLRILHKGAPTSVYLAASPVDLNGPGRTWDLDAILSAIQNAKRYIYIHVMDYIPMLVYREPQEYWPVIDDALRKAVIENGVEVKLLAAALHFVPQTLRFLKSLESLNGLNRRASIQVKIFKVPTDDTAQSVVARERRTHNKFIVTDDTVIIGTSNWSGDYFIGNTGVALVVRQAEGDRRPFVQELKEIFVRDWDSDYSHSLKTYYELCVRRNDASFCQAEKDPSQLYKQEN